MAEPNPYREEARRRLRRAQAEVDAQLLRIMWMRRSGTSSNSAEKTLKALADARDKVVAEIREIDPDRT